MGGLLGRARGLMVAAAALALLAGGCTGDTEVPARADPGPPVAGPTPTGDAPVARAELLPGRKAARAQRERVRALARRKARREARLLAREPLRGPWGVYRGPSDKVWGPYQASTGETRALLSYIAEKPRTHWFGAWIPTSEIGARLRDHIAVSQAGDPDALVQLAIFRMDPWYTASKSQRPSPAQVADYKAWIDESARAIGDTRTALVLQPDSTFLRTVPDFALSSGLIRYAAQAYGALPNTRVYLETGGADWPSAGQGGAAEAVRLLAASGIEYADGVATNTTHYNSTSDDVRRIAEIVELFEKRGVKGLKGVVNTSSNGNGFDFGTYTGPDPDDAFVCQPGRLTGTCVTLGIPPTWEVADARWGLDAETRRLAEKYVDAYLWIGRPWLYRQNDPFRMDRALALVRSTPWR